MRLPSERGTKDYGSQKFLSRPIKLVVIKIDAIKVNAIKLDAIKVNAIQIDAIWVYVPSGSACSNVKFSLPCKSSTVITTFSFMSESIIVITSGIVKFAVLFSSGT